MAETDDTDQDPTRATGPGADEGRAPLDPLAARRAAIEALTAYRAARDPAGLAAVFHRLAEDATAHWLLPGLLSLASQLVDYLSVSERVDPDDVVRALASLELEADWTDGEPPAGE